MILDGRLVCSCLVLGAEAEGREVETVEGMADGDTLHPLQQKFLEHAALQCGICTPGFLMAAKALLEQNPNPTGRGNPLSAGRQPLPLHRLRQDRSRRRRTPPLTCEEHEPCRSTPSPILPAHFKVIGTRPLRPDGVDKVTGRARFGADPVLPGMLVGHDPALPACRTPASARSTSSKAAKLPA